MSSTSSDGNVTDTTSMDISPTYSLLNVLLGSGLVALCALSLIVHGLTCYVIRRSRRLQSTTNYFILSLSVLALVDTAVTMALTSEVFLYLHWPLGDVACRAVAWLVQACCNTNSFVLIYISVDRFYAIKYPLSFKITRGKAKRLILVGWAFGYVLALPELYLYRYQSVVLGAAGEVWTCMISVKEDSVHEYLTLGTHIPLAVAVCVVPSLAMFVAYLRVSQYIWTLARTPKVHLQRTEHAVPRNKIKVLKLLFLITFTDFLGSVGFFILLFVGLYRFQALYFLVSAVLLFFMHLTKPVLFLLLNGNYRRAMKEVLCWYHQNLYRQEAYMTVTGGPLAMRNYVGLMPNSVSGDNSQQTTTSQATQIRNLDWFQMKPDSLNVVRKEPDLVFNRSMFAAGSQPQWSV